MTSFDVDENVRTLAERYVSHITYMCIRFECIMFVSFWVQPINSSLNTHEIPGPGCSKHR